MDPNSDTTTNGSAETRASEARFIGRYRVKRLLGSGGMGQVYLAHDPVLDRAIAVKLIGAEIDDPDARGRLVQEARAAGRLRHPNIVTIFDAGEHDGSPYIAMEHVGGETLRALIKRRDPVPLARRLDFVESACAGLAHAHRANVVHLDIKPDNLMLDADGVLKVVDFGIARVLQHDALQTMHLAGTLRYMSPEQVSGRPMDRRSDVFSLGCSLFELIAYEPAYTGSPAALAIRISSGPVPRLADALPGVDARLDALVARAMALEPADRFDDLDELGAALGTLRRELDPEAMPRPLAPVAAVGPSRRGRAPMLAGAAAVTLAASLAVWVASPLGPRRVEPAVPAPAETAAVSTPTLQSPPTTPPPLVRPSAPPTPVAAGTPPATSAGGPAAAASAAPVGPSEEVWRRLARGDRAGVMELLRQVERREAAPRIAFDVLDAVRPAAQQARDAASSPGSRASAAYRSGDESLARAAALAQSRQPVEAVTAIWQAQDLFVSAVADGRGAASPTPVQAPEVARGTPPPPASASAESARPAAAPPAPVAPDTDSDDVLAALRRYHQAYTARDASAVRQMYPSLGSEQLEQLRKSFEAVTAYEITLRQPRVEVKGNTASVRALVARRIVPRVGQPVTNEVDTEFDLQRDARGWLIVAVTARP